MMPRSLFRVPPAFRVAPADARFPGALFACLMALCLGLPAAAADTGEDRWSVMMMQGQKIGWMREGVRTNDDGHTVSTTHTEMTMRRGEIAIEMVMKTEFVETPDGEPVRMRYMQNLGSAPMETRYVFTDDGVRVTTLQFGRKTTRTEPLPEGEWLTPEEMRIFIEKRVEAGADRIEVATVSPATGLEPFVSVYTRKGEGNVEVFGKTVPAIEFEVTESVANTTSATFVDRTGAALRTETAMGGITIEMLATSEALATAPFDAPEMMNDSLIHIDQDIPDARTSRRASFIVHHDSNDPVDLIESGSILDAGVQRVARVAGRHAAVRVIVDLDDNRAAMLTEDERAEALGYSAYIDPTDPEIVALAKRAARASAGFDEASDMQKAEMLEDFVAGYVQYKNLGVGFATSAEVCRTREGDCSEHAMLLAALLRAHEIPARAVTGLVYADGFMGERRIFGYHMWTQALVEHEGESVWHDVDAAIRTMDATHIAMGASTYAGDDPVEGMLDVITVFGSLAIEVESVE